MNKKEIEKEVGKELTKGSYSLDKSIYKGILYFFKREIEQDHYFYVTAEDKLYVMFHNKENYDEEITLSGKFPDSFQFNFEGAILDGRVRDVKALSYADIGVPIKEVPKPVMELQPDLKPLALKDEIDDIIIKLVELKSRL
jgi:hypothetical protein